MKMTDSSDVVGTIVEDVLEKIIIYGKLRELEQSAAGAESVRKQLEREATDKLAEIRNYLLVALNELAEEGVRQ